MVLLATKFSKVTTICKSYANMTAKSFAKGSAIPPSRKPGALRLYSMRFCPFATRVRLVLAAKNIPYETVNINLQEKPEWYLELYPTGKVPVLEGDGVFLSESLIISDYLDEAYPGDKLTPTDAYKKAKDKMILEVAFTKVTAFLFKARRNPEAVDEALKEVQLAFAELERELKTRNTIFFGGNKPSMLDLMMWPWFEIFMIVHNGLGKEYVFSSILPREKYPLMNRWIEALLKFPAVKDLHDPDNLSCYFESMIAGKKTNYDVGL